MKWLSFLLFGIGTLVLVLLIFPVMCLFLHPKERFQKHARPLVSCIMRLFTSIMYGMGIVEVDADDLKVYRGLVSKIVVANHPSLLDVVILFSLIPNADCIVNGNLSHNIIWGVIQRLYIPNSLNFEKLSQVCIQSLSQGNCIIIFPEGTRTPRSGEMSLKKGAARLALQSGCAIVPIHIGGTDKYGLGKHDPWWGFNPVDKYLYRIRMQGALAPQKYADLPASIAVKHLTTDIKEILLHPLHC
jgi:1-acyl-sn-glycerol-3-phosphate acyltransferase